MLATCDTCGHTIDRDLQAAVNLARLSEHASRWKAGPPGVARWQAAEPPEDQPTPGAAAEATNRQPRTAARSPPDRRGLPSAKERLPEHEHSHLLTRRQRSSTPDAIESSVYYKAPSDDPSSGQDGMSPQAIGSNPVWVLMSVEPCTLRYHCPEGMELTPGTVVTAVA